MLTQNNPLTDFHFFDALECGLRLQYERSEEAHQSRSHEFTHSEFSNRSESSPRVGNFTQTSYSDLKSALYQRLLRVFIKQEGVKEIQPEQFSIWLNQSTPGACFDVPFLTGPFQTSIPLLYRDQSEQLYMVHFQGRKWSKKERSFRPTDLDRPKVKRSIQKLALQELHLLLKNPHLQVRSLLIFPDSAYRKDPSLTLEDIFRYDSSIHKSDERSELFARVEVTEWVQNEKETVQSLWDQFLTYSMDPHTFEPGKKCFSCRYRKQIPGKRDGCWHLQADLNGIQSPHLHTPDLPGHGNISLVESGVLFQEQILEAVHESPSQLTLQWRRAKQIELAQGVPNQSSLSSREFIHPLMRQRIEELTFPIHCIDFEAASFPVSPGFPRKPYIPVIFQFSCHSIYSKKALEQGEFHHTQWIDTGFSADPEIELIHQLNRIDQIEEGTLFHFAPFEKQHLFKLYSRAKKGSSPEWNSLKSILEKIVQPTTRIPRFMDMADWVNRYYFHEQMEGGLGLKNLHQALLFELKEEDLRLDRTIPISHQVKNGEHAMHVYLGLRTGALNSKDKDHWAQRLLDYCAMDTRVMARALMYWDMKLSVS